MVWEYPTYFAFVIMIQGIARSNDVAYLLSKLGRKVAYIQLQNTTRCMVSIDGGAMTNDQVASFHQITYKECNITALEGRQVPCQSTLCHY